MKEAMLLLPAASAKSANSKTVMGASCGVAWTVNETPHEMREGDLGWFNNNRIPGCKSRSYFLDRNE